jgi:hypothetical protein
MKRTDPSEKNRDKIKINGIIQLRRRTLTNNEKMKSKDRFTNRHWTSSSGSRLAVIIGKSPNDVI